MNILNLESKRIVPETKLILLGLGKVLFRRDGETVSIPFWIEEGREEFYEGRFLFNPPVNECRIKISEN